MSITTIRGPKASRRIIQALALTNSVDWLIKNLNMAIKFTTKNTKIRNFHNIRIRLECLSRRGIVAITVKLRSNPVISHIPN